MKLLVWFVKIVLTVLLVSSLTLLTTGLIVQSYAKSLLASFNIQWEGQPMGLTAMFQGALGGKTSEGNKSGKGTTDQPTGADEEQVPEDAVSVMGNGSEGGESGVDKGNSGSQGASSGEGAGEGSGTNSTAGSNSGVNAGNGTDSGTGNESGTAQGSGSASGNGTGATSGSTPSDNDAIVVSPDDITGAKDKLPVEEKERIFSLLMNKLPQKEMQQISGAMEGGLTEQELREIEQVISKYLTSEEYDNLMEVLQTE
ncbi:hypothetical protein BK131_14705 [Paenibacillus amylolyticus]|uniref:Spore coat protein n=1 Tax=Paenibacillus amylolyticus TaxID=1451 RepID=A0A1R1BVU4_PAEAM|nr:hypothetical protein [Paenibacillus amylolyticus]OMF13898.1 hypothetical protein BK131_14705 [Paenibacillus amylolyticus]